MPVATFVSDLLGDLDDIRGIPGELGLRPWTVSVRKRTWSGSRIGQGTKTDTNTTLVHQYEGSTQPVRVQQMSRKEILASGGQYKDGDYKVGPMTPAYAAQVFGPPGGYTDAVLDPAPTTTPTETFYIVSGAGWPAGGGYAEKIGEEIGAMHYYVMLRPSGRADG